MNGIMRIAAVLLLALLGVGQARAEVLRLAVTTSFANSGLADILLPAIKRDTGLDVQLLIVGTGQALALGAAGDVDAVLVHSRTAEEEWIAAGHGTHRREIMFNDFVIIGPAEDPAAVIGAKTAVEGLRRILNARAPFVSRGDDSGTHRKERALWSAAGLEPAGSWYRAVGQGMGAALNTAAAMDAYTLSDRATWLKFANKRNLRLLFSGDPLLFNQYAYLPVNPARHPHVSAATEKLEAWLTSDTARKLIDGYRLNGQRLFTFNAH